MKNKNDNKNRFVALDFETMNSWRASVCSLSIVVIKDNKIVDKHYYKICPPSKDESYYCTLTHGMHYDDVKDCPDFKTVWENVDKIIDGCPIIAHNAPFEKSCINECAYTFGTNDDYEYIDTLKLSRKYFPNLYNHKLNTVCENIHHNLEHHHNALDDALACAAIFINLNKKYKLYE